MVDAPGLPQDSLQVRWWPFLQLGRRFEVNRITNPPPAAPLLRQLPTDTPRMKHSTVFSEEFLLLPLSRALEMCCACRPT
jgi:hypothetical protein